jgi:alkanesulfonate monooxygenase SsuD/methylene tetrahydromethanopterin reductase-like flavin-dependent oxidoreductase (luciferase family)
MVETIAILGTPEQAAKELVRRFGEHADRACLYFPGYEMSDERLSRLVDEIKRAVA